MKIVSNLLCAVSLSFLLGSSLAQASVQLLDKEDWKVSFYGFVQADAIVDSTRSLSEIAGNSPVDRRTTFAGDNGRTQMTIRNSRFGFLINSPKENDWASKAVLEFDLLGPGAPPAAAAEAGTFSNAVLRVRHFYLKSEKDGWQILAGQHWALFGWQPNYFLITDSIPAVSGVIFQRTVQLTILKDVAVSESGNILSGVSVVKPAQRDSRVPGLDLGVRYSNKSRKAGYVAANAENKVQGMSLGVSGRLNEFAYSKTAGDTAASSHLLGSAIAVNGMLPLIAAKSDETGNTLALSGEFSTGRGYSEAFPGFTGNLKAYGDTLPASPLQAGGTNIDAGQIGVDSNGVRLVHLRTYNMQLQYHLPQAYQTFVTTGFGELYSNNIDTMTVGLGGKIPYNRSRTYFANIFHDFSKQVRLAGEFDHFRTSYSDGIVAHNNRVQLTAYFLF